MASITIHVRPAVFRWINNNFKEVKGKYDVRNSFLHEMITAGLIRQTNHNILINKDYFSTYKPVQLIVSAHWTDHYGYLLTDENQYRINATLYKILTHEICTGVMHGYLFGGIPKNKLMKEYLLSLMYEETELNLACISKIYQRKYLPEEKKLREKFDITITKL
jgi:hypothetical protein